MNQEEIKSILPHRENMLLIDEANLIDEKACGRYHVRGDEWFLQGHFPGNPVVPGVILCEIMAQSVCVLLGASQTAGVIPYFTGIDKVRFKRPVRPGEIIETECVLTKTKPPFYFASGRVFVEGKLCVTAEFSFALIKD